MAFPIFSIILFLAGTHCFYIGYFFQDQHSRFWLDNLFRPDFQACCGVYYLNRPGPNGLHYRRGRLAMTVTPATFFFSGRMLA
jgi:hypothetical protein